MVGLEFNVAIIYGNVAKSILDDVTIFQKSIDTRFVCANIEV